MTIRIDTTVHLPVKPIARALADSGEETAKFFVWLSSLGDGEFRRELELCLKLRTPEGERKAVRELALLIAGACSEPGHA